MLINNMLIITQDLSSTEQYVISSCSLRNNELFTFLPSKCLRYHLVIRMFAVNTRSSSSPRGIGRVASSQKTRRLATALRISRIKLHLNRNEEYIINHRSATSRPSHVAARKRSNYLLSPNDKRLESKLASRKSKSDSIYSPFVVHYLE